MNNRENKTSVFIIVLNWNGADDTIECIDSLLLSHERNFSLVITDNGSEQNNYDKLYNWCKSKFQIINCIDKEHALLSKFDNLNFSDNAITFLKNGENLGFAIANNIATRFALYNGAEEVLLLNNDTIVTPAFLKNLLDFSKSNPDYVALTPLICLAEPRDIIWNCGGRITWFGNRRYFFAGQNISKVPDIKYSDITFITGCALYYKPMITGLLSEQFFFGEEDFEFSLRLRQKKLKMACVYNSVIHHKVGNSINKTAKVSFNAIFLQYVSRLIDHKNYYIFPFRWLIMVMNSTYGFYLTFILYKYGFLKSIKFWFRICLYVIKHDKISKNDFINIMKLSF